MTNHTEEKNYRSSRSVAEAQLLAECEMEQKRQTCLTSSREKLKQGKA